MVLARLLGCHVFVLVLLVGGLVASGHAAGVDIVACFDGAVPSDPQTCSAGVRLDIISIKSELTNTATIGGGGGGAGKAQFAPFAIVKPLDKTSPKLFLAAATGVHTPTLGIGIFDTSGQKTQPVFSITLTDVVITRIADTAQDTASPGTLASMETVAFEFSKIELLDEVSKERACYNVIANVKC